MIWQHALPLQNKQAMIFLQSRDRDLRRVKELLLAGQRPNDKRDRKAVKVFFRTDVNTSIDNDGCLVVIKRNRKNLVYWSCPTLSALGCSTAST